MSIDDELIPGQTLSDVASDHPAWEKSPLAGIAELSRAAYRVPRVKRKLFACLTLIESPLYGAVLFGTLDGSPATVRKLMDEMNITRRHIAQSACRGPRPSAP